MTAQEINAWTSPLLILGVIVLTAAMVLRLVRHWVSGRKAPILLVRDVSIYLALILAIGGGQYTRWTGVRLSDQVWWVLLTSLVYGAAVALWLFVELALVGRTEDE